MVAGWTINVNSDVFLVKIQDIGDTLWTKSTGQGAANDVAFGITPTADNGFLIAGKNYNLVNNHNDMYILKIDADGDSLWSYSHITNTHDEAHVAHQAADGNIYLFGTRASSSSGDYRDYWVFKFSAPVDVPYDDQDLMPSTFALSPNYPNPFNPKTKIEFTVPRVSDVTIEIYNVMGQKIKTLVNERMQPGLRSVTWDGTDDKGVAVATGVYLYRMTAGDFVESKKMVLLK
jgi:hypothetical protein